MSQTEEFIRQAKSIMDRHDCPRHHTGKGRVQCVDCVIRLAMNKTSCSSHSQVVRDASRYLEKLETGIYEDLWEDQWQPKKIS